jgi:hypothetical protein
VSFFNNKIQTESSQPKELFSQADLTKLNPRIKKHQKLTRELKTYEIGLIFLCRKFQAS